MQFELIIRCDCGNQDLIIPERIQQKMNGVIYEDFSSILDGVSESNKFSLHQEQEDEIKVTCKECGKTHDLTT